MKKAKLSLKDLIEENKQELLLDKEEVEKIEKRLDEKYVKLTAK
ncbi:FbpB family small basic protein [Salinibacillus xinjiangensis]|uniref:FbpB family small basic protein n=1 Tax=Salinibacillus xinjiangensis TaxID=1229268 RepID=A0A6G1XA17_9BACI|nr:FbpB family small basic protein [Salinibacillus xinjiangensis]MRG87787.1 FbpB family small basic protein [Salinibacillus xinjiangensis]